MTILTELSRLYDRLQTTGDAPPPGYSMENIGGEVVLDRAGRVLAIRDLRVADEKGKPRPRKMAVPARPLDRTGKKIVSGFLWDPAPYCLGVSLDESGELSLDTNNAQKKFEIFRDVHRHKLDTTNDAALTALRLFVETWKPERIADFNFSLDIIKENGIVFRLEGATNENNIAQFIHEGKNAIDLAKADENDAQKAFCLIAGKNAPVARIHQKIKGVWGTEQSNGALFTSFNKDAFNSYGKKQGENAPISQSASFAFGTALNVLLTEGSGRNLRIGDTTVVFWAETANAITAQSIDEMLFGALNPPDEAAETARLRATLENIAEGRPAGPEFAPETRVFVLGINRPNKARLSVRFWMPGTLRDFARHVTRFWADLALEPPAWKGPPAAWSLLYEVAMQRKAENIPPRLGGELMQAVLRGTPYPRTLLSGVIQRIRADGDINRKRVAILTAYIRRNLQEKEFPMSLDRDNPNPAYRLGRLFAVLEGIQLKALPGLNATIKDRYFAAASATPARVFPLLVKTGTHHLSKLRKDDGGGLAHWFDAEMGAIWAGLEANLPRALNLEDQGRFIAGYYHQRWAKKDTNDDVIDNGSTQP